MNWRPAMIALLTLGALLAGCTTGSDDGPGPTSPVAGSIDGSVSTVRAEERDIYRTIRLEGTIENNDPVPVTATETGRFVPVKTAKRARAVNKGERIGTIQCPPAQSASTGPADDDKTAGPAPAVSATPSPSSTPACRVPVRASAAGKMPALRDREVTEGEAITAVQPPGLRIRLPVIDAAMLYAFKHPPKSGKAEIVGGPSGFTVTYKRRLYDKGSGQSTVLVRMPDDVEAFAGLKAIVVFVTDVKDDLLTLPLSAVRGRSGTGQVVTVDSQGNQAIVNVELGAADDAYIAVEGLDADTDVLLYPLESNFGG